MRLDVGQLRARPDRREAVRPFDTHGSRAAAGPGPHKQTVHEGLGRYSSGGTGWAGGLILTGGVLRLPARLDLEPAPVHPHGDSHHAGT